MKLLIQIAVVLTLGTALAGVGWRMRELQDQVDTLQAGNGGRTGSSGVTARNGSEKAGVSDSSGDLSGRVDRVEDAIRHLAEKTASPAPALAAKDSSAETEADEDEGEDSEAPVTLSPEAAALLQDPKMKQALTEAVAAVIAEQRKKEQEQRAEERRKKTLEQLTKALELSTVQTDAIGKALDTFRGSLQVLGQNKDMSPETRKAEREKAFQALDQTVAYSLTANQQAKYADMKKKNPWMIRAVGGDDGGGGGDRPRRNGNKGEKTSVAQ